MASHLWLGSWSGLLGGAFAGIFIGVGSYQHYLVNDPRKMENLSEMMLYALVVGASTGIGGKIGTAWFLSLSASGRRPSWLFNELTGGTLAGAVGGVPVGLLGGWWFGPQPFDFIDPPILFGGALAGTVLVSVALVLNESVVDWSRVLLSCLVSLVAMMPVYFLASRCTYLLAMKYFVDSGFATGGAILGFILGGIMGAQLGLALLVYRYWHSAERAPA